MELKDYQKHCINEVKVYLEHLVEFRAKYEKILAIVPGMAGDFTRKAWEKTKGGTTFQGAIHYDKKNGLGKPLTNFCIKCIKTDGSLLPCPWRSLKGVSVGCIVKMTDRQPIGSTMFVFRKSCSQSTLLQSLS